MFGYWNNNFKCGCLNAWNIIIIFPGKWGGGRSNNWIVQIIRLITVFDSQFGVEKKSFFTSYFICLFFFSGVKLSP